MQYKKLTLIVVSFLLLVSVTETGCGSGQESSTVEAKAESEPITQVEKNYTTHCASCHGEKMIAFADRDWKHGNSDSALYASISHTWAKDVPSFDSSLRIKHRRHYL